MKYCILLGLILLSVADSGCHQTEPDNNADNEESAVTPVTITQADTAVLKETITLNAVSTFLLNTDVKANVNGYITRSAIHNGEKVHQGQTLFVLETREARSIGNTINQLDSTFKFSGNNTVKSPSSGYVIMLNHQPGDYVQDGEVLATVANEPSFGFMLSLPYEDRQLLLHNKNVVILLPDSTLLQGTVLQWMPQMDSLIQTQQVFIKTRSHNTIPAGLIAQAILAGNASSHPSLPTAAVLSDESQQHFWVMKLLSDSMAVKIPIQKGVESGGRVEIVAPAVQATDRFVLQGAYGLPDTAQVAIQH
ncbi:efflux RND transporter periplasmic adaptor subunit [Compostibacter hankyongensis]|uniref:CzcB-like barrel-sandwich hybrid domain-containing protein n=1 Tax=Compostibacter hankyongensis TaxID=1007089 RepID=A0ABP8FR41_9BACT